MSVSRTLNTDNPVLIPAFAAHESRLVSSQSVDRTMYIRPKFTLSDIYDPDLIFNPRASFTAPGWLPPDPAVLDSFTGHHLTVAGDLPIMVSNSVLDEGACALLRRAGFDLAARAAVYDGEHEYLTHLASPDKRFVMQHIHPPAELTAGQYWIPPALLAFLNNKANLAELVPPRYVPRRKIKRADSLPAAAADWRRLPLVIKAVSDQSSGAGVAVKICRSQAELRDAANYFASCEAVVVEEFLNIARSFCVQFVATREKAINYLGSAEQVVNADGRHLGNWLDPHRAATETMTEVGRSIMEQAVALGYQGFAGFDMARLADGRIVVLDLNFRLNGSTVPLLLYDAIAERYHAHTMRYCGLKMNGSWQQLLCAAEKALDKKYLVPLSAYRPPDASRDAPRLNGLIIGTSRDQVISRQRELAGLGLD